MGKTLDYDSCAKWMSLAVWAAGAYDRWDADRELAGKPADDEWYTWVFHQTAVEALNRGFSLRAGNRQWAVSDLLLAVAPHNSEMQAAFYRIDREAWLTPPGAKPERERRNRNV